MNADSRPQKNAEASGAAVFCWWYAVASIWHHTSSSNEVFLYWINFDPVQTPLVLLSIISAFMAAVLPGNARAFMAMIAVQFFVTCVRLPFTPTHVVMELFFSASVLLAWLHLRIRSGKASISLDQLYHSFSGPGRVLLLAMYFFGTFHKINPGFLSLESSCALPFLNGLPLPQVLLANAGFQYATIYGVLILEFAAMLLLMTARTKYYGMAIGIPFHIAIGISSFGTLAHFSSLALAFHALFLPPEFLRRLRETGWIPAPFKSRHAVQVLTVALILGQMLCANRAYWTAMNMVFLSVAGPFYLLILRFGRSTNPSTRFRLLSDRMSVNAIPLLFIFHCAGPYIGLSTVGVVQMFSGLHTEGGVSNHYIVRQPLYWFPYQRDVVTVLESNDPFLASLKEKGEGLTLTDYRRFVMTSDSMRLPLLLEINGERIEVRNVDDAQKFVDEWYEPLNFLEYKLLLFRNVDTPHPRKCKH